MKIAVLSYSNNGIERAKEIKECLDSFEVNLYSSKDEAGFIKINKPTDILYERLFNEMDALIFVGATGIAIRSIAPFIKSKVTDPAVIVMDELGKYTISLLSGHLGGANKLTKMLANHLNSIPVITTATDINDKISIDSFAKENDMHISSMEYAKLVSSTVLDSDVAIASDFKIKNLKNGLKLSEEGPLGIYIGYKKKNLYEKTLRLVPKVIHCGIGCRRDTPLNKIKDAFYKVLEENNIDRLSIIDLSTIDLKKDEKGLLEFSKNENLPIYFYSKDELNSIEGEFTKSEFVNKITGVDCVSERACMVNGKKIIVKKTKCDSVTIALSVIDMEVNFE